jgi:hypothetical protein
MLGSCNNHLQYIDGVIITRAFLISELNIFPHIGVGDIVGAKYHVRIM